MGWTYYHATKYKANGKVDVAKEVESLIDLRYKILKGSVVGNAYYMAVKDTETEKVTGYVVLFRQVRDAYNFGYKLISEEAGPCECDCPKSILDLLSETDSEWAMDWRRKCVIRSEIKARERSKIAELKKLPLNAVIEFYAEFTSNDGSVGKGDMVQLKKILYGGKEIWFDGKYRWKPSLISEHYAVGI